MIQEENALIANEKPFISEILIENEDVHNPNKIVSKNKQNTHFNDNGQINHLRTLTAEVILKIISRNMGLGIVVGLISILAIYIINNAINAAPIFMVFGIAMSALLGCIVFITNSMAQLNQN